MAGTENRGIYHSDDGGRHWKSDGALRGLTVYDIAFHDEDPAWMMAATHGSGVYVSIDGGSHWKQRNKGLKQTNVHSVAFYGDTLMAGTIEGGIYLSRNRGRTWEFNALDGAQVWSLTVEADHE